MRCPKVAVVSKAIMLLKWLQIELSRNYFSAPHQSRWAVACMWILAMFWGATLYRTWLCNICSGIFEGQRRGVEALIISYSWFTFTFISHICKAVRARKVLIFVFPEQALVCIGFFCLKWWGRKYKQLKRNIYVYIFCVPIIENKQSSNSDICWLASSGRPIIRLNS